MSYLYFTIFFPFFFYFLTWYYLIFRAIFFILEMFNSQNFTPSSNWQKNLSLEICGIFTYFIAFGINKVDVIEIEIILIKITCLTKGKAMNFYCLRPNKPCLILSYPDPNFPLSVMTSLLKTFASVWSTLSRPAFRFFSGSFSTLAGLSG